MSSTQYRVVEGWPIVQVTSPNPHATGSAAAGSYENTERTFRSGDALPAWLDQSEIKHLLSIGAIEATS